MTAQQGEIPIHDQLILAKKDAESWKTLARLARERAEEAEGELKEMTGVMRALRRQRDTAEATVDRLQEWLAGWGPQLPANARETLAQALSGPKQNSGAEP